MKKNYVALGGMFAGLHLVFLLFSKIIFGSELLMVIFLPLLSTIYTLKCDKKSVIMFVIATLLICFVFDFVSTFIYVIPSLICGVTYGLLRKKECEELELLCLSGLAHTVSIAFSFFVIVLLFKEVDFLAVFGKLFNLEGEKLIVFSLLMLLVIGYCEAFLVHIISDNELSKFMESVKKNASIPKWFILPCIVSFSLFVILCIFNSLYSVLPLFILFIFFIPYIVNGILNLKYKVLTTSLIIVFFLVSIFLIKYIDPINYLILPVFVCSPFVINNFKDKSLKNF